MHRVENGQTYTQVFDAENRLISVTAAGGQTTQFLYDCDGNLVKKIKPDGSRTLYIGGVYEIDKNSSGKPSFPTGRAVASICKSVWVQIRCGIF